MEVYRGATLVVALGAGALLGGSIGAQDAAFPFTAEQFMKMYNDHTPKGDDRILAIKKRHGEAVAVLDDSDFQRGIQMMKEMDLANGRFTMDIKIILTLDKNARVSMIVVSGTRSDPVNMMRTIGTIGTIYEILNPGYTDKTEQAFLGELGLMRGDADPTIGNVKNNFSRGAAFACNNQNSNITTKFGCWIVPRS